MGGREGGREGGRAGRLSGDGRVIATRLFGSPRSLSRRGHPLNRERCDKWGRKRDLLSFVRARAPNAK